MLILPSSVKVFLCTRPTDMRCGFNKLSMLAEHVMHQDPLSVDMMASSNRRQPTSCPSSLHGKAKTQFAGTVNQNQS